MNAAQAAFYSDWSPYAAQAGQALGVDPSVVLAQWALESGYGAHQPGSYNVGGIGGPGNWQSYSSPQDFANAYVSLIQTGYPCALNTGSDAMRFAQGLGSGAGGSYFGSADPVAYGNSLAQIAGAIPTVTVTPGDTPPAEPGWGFGPNGLQWFNTNGTTSATSPGGVSPGGLLSGTLSIIEELAIRIMLVLVGLVLLGSGFYVAGSRGARAVTVRQLGRAVL